jgi:hypothetical protein
MGIKVMASDPTYKGSDTSGVAIPAIKFSSNKHSITTPEFPAAATSFSFWYRGNVTSSSSIRVSASNETGWTELDNVPMTNETGVTLSYPLAASSAYTRFELYYNKPTDGKFAAIDDVTVQYGDGTRVYTLTNEAVGAVTSYQVTNLVEGLYWYVVRATDDTAGLRRFQRDQGEHSREPPQIVPFTSQTVRVGETFTCDVVIQETNGDPVTETNVTASQASPAHGR